MTKLQFEPQTEGIVESRVGYSIEVPKYKWRLHLTHNGLAFDLTYSPNWFHRLMQRICFGFKWEKL